MIQSIAKASGLEHEIIKLADLEIKHCRGCVRCGRSKRCVQKDDMLSLYDKLEAAQGLIFGGVNHKRLTTCIKKAASVRRRSTTKN